MTSIKLLHEILTTSELKKRINIGPLIIFRPKMDGERHVQSHSRLLFLDMNQVKVLTMPLLSSSECCWCIGKVIGQVITSDNVLAEVLEFLCNYYA